MEPNAARHRMLATQHLSSDTCVNHALRLLAQAHGQVSGTGRLKRGWKVQSAFGDATLAGGGAHALEAKLHKIAAFCPNREIKYGRLVCQRLLPPGHVGPCPDCQTATDKVINGVAEKNTVHHYIRMAPYYKITAQTTDLIQLVVNYWPLSYSRLSRDPDDNLARVYCVESGLIARQDFRDRPGKFALDVEAQVGEYAFVRDGEGVLTRVKVVREEENRFQVEMPDGRLALEPKSRVEKIGGAIPVNVCVFDDGADVFHSAHMNYR